MRILLALAFLLPALAHAEIKCTLMQPSDPVSSPNTYDKVISEFAFTKAKGAKTGRHFFLKTDGSVVEINRPEFDKKTDFSEVDGAKFFTFRREGAYDYILSFGNVDISHGSGRDALKVIGMGNGAIGTPGLNLWWLDQKLTGTCFKK